jgi:hypothetical protein
MPNSGYIRKRSARNIIAGMFVFFTLGLGIGLQYVKQQAQNQAASINNRTTCALRALVDPAIAGYERTLDLSLKTSNDQSVKEAVRLRAAATARNTQKTLSGLQNFRAVYNTVPPGYKCPHDG